MVVTQWFAPEPSVQPVRIARALRDAGHDVGVLTGIPNYPLGRVYEGYNAARVMDDVLDGFAVRRTPLYPSHGSSSMGRLLNYASWAISSSVLGSRFFRGRDAVLVYSSPATAALAAMIAKARHGVPYVLLVQDVWPDSVFASGFLKGPARRLVEMVLGGFVRRSYASASHVVVISPGMKDLLVARGVPAEKIVLVYNSVPELEELDSVASISRSQVNLAEESVVFMYAGNHGAAQGLDALIDAMALLAVDSNIELVLMGEGVEKDALQSRVEALGLTNVRFLPSVPRDEMSSYSKLADVQVVALADRPLFSVTMPSKVQSILASGQPMLAIARGDVAAVISKAGCGRVADPGKPTAIADAMQFFAAISPTQRSAMGRAGKSYYENEMSPEINNSRLVATMRESAQGRRKVRLWPTM